MLRQKVVRIGLEQEETEARAGMEWERQRGGYTISRLPKRLETWKH